MNSLTRLTKADCGRPMTAQERRSVQLGMLDALAAFCDANGLRCFLSGGTLLGAVRHRGFIPWDDDVDVNMPRPDCEKLLELTGGDLNGFRVVGPDMDRFSMCCEAFRLYDLRTVIESYDGGATKTHPNYCPIFLDIFPIEGLPDSPRATRRHYRRIVFLRRMQRSSALEHRAGSSPAAHVFHAVTRIPARVVGYRRWSAAVQRTATKYGFDEQNYVGVMTAPVHTVEERVVKKDYMNPTEVFFEGKKYHAPGCWDVYLSRLYGPDYMQLPPEGARERHPLMGISFGKDAPAGERGEGAL